MSSSAVLSLLALAALLASVQAQVKCPATLKKWAFLPAKTFVKPPQGAPGFFDTAGKFERGPRNHRNSTLGAFTNCQGNNPTLCTDQNSPWRGQAVQGFSGIRVYGESEQNKYFWILTDNGMGNKRNSPDALLMFHKVVPDWGKKTVKRTQTIFMSDPKRRVPFAIRNEPSSSLRLLTGSDFDPESIQLVGNRIYIGEEFGPYLIELNTKGQVEAVYETPFNGTFIRSPDHPAMQLPNPSDAMPVMHLKRSKGFEGMASYGEMIYPLMEGAIWNATLRQYENLNGREYLRIFAFNTTSKTWSTNQPLKYLLEDSSHAIGDFNCVNQRFCMIIERDNAEGDPNQACTRGFVNATCFASPAAFKRVYLIDMQSVDGNNFVKKVAYVDLMDMKDPDGVSPRSRNGVLNFPFVTIEDVDVYSARDDYIIVGNDNNFPYSMGRTLGKADDNELAVLHVPGFFNGGNCA